MSSPKVSVLMPNYNGKAYISESIESILNQSFTDFEFIIIDDGSTDNSWDIIQNYAKKDKRIVAVQNKDNLGISRTRNKLLQHSKAAYIAWQDSDDISTMDRIEKQYHHMISNKEIGICGGGLQFFDQTGNKSQRLYKENDDEARKTIFRYSPLSQGASMYLREAIDKVGGYDDSLSTAEDLDLSFRIGRHYSFANIPEIVLHYRQHDSDTHTNLKQMELNTIKIRWKNHKTNFYTMGLGDKVYNILQYISIYIIPSKTKIQLFNLIRNK